MSKNQNRSLLTNFEEQKYRKLMKTGCTGCRYCMPCPSGVDIPTCFEVYDNLYLSGNENEGKLMYTAKAGGIIGGMSLDMLRGAFNARNALKNARSTWIYPACLKLLQRNLRAPTWRYGRLLQDRLSG